MQKTEANNKESKRRTHLFGFAFFVVGDVGIAPLNIFAF